MNQENLEVPDGSYVVDLTESSMDAEELTQQLSMRKSRRKPSDAHKQGFSVTFYSTKLFGDSPSRELSSSQIGMLDFVKALYMAAETNPKFKTHVPKVKIGEAPKRKVGKGNTRTPGFEITGWADRPEELGGALPVASPSAAAVTAPAAAASDDVSFGDEI